LSAIVSFSTGRSLEICHWCCAIGSEYRGNKTYTFPK